jgi:hypothetical protein
MMQRRLYCITSPQGFRHTATQAIDSKLTVVGKDERAISVSGYVFRGEVKYTEHAFHKTITYKRRALLVSKTARRTRQGWVSTYIEPLDFGTECAQAWLYERS